MLRETEETELGENTTNIVYNAGDGLAWIDEEGIAQKGTRKLTTWYKVS